MLYYMYYLVTNITFFLENFIGAVKIVTLGVEHAVNILILWKTKIKNQVYLTHYTTTNSKS